MKQTLNFDAIIIGAGAAGLTAAIYLKRANYNVLIIEKSMPGGQMNFSSTIENYPGFEMIDGPSLSMNMYNQVLKLGVEFVFDAVSEIQINGDIKEVICTNETYTSKNVIIASGRKRKILGLDNEEKYVGHGISYCAFCDGMFFKNKNVAIIGGGNSTLEESLQLSNIVNSIVIINRSSEFKGEKIMIDKVLSNEKIEVVYNSQVTKLIGDDVKLSGITYKNNTSNEEKTLDIDGLFIFIGYESESIIYDKLPLNKKNGYLLIDDRCETNIEGIYAVGDALYKEAYQIVTATAEGAIAAMDIIKKLS